MKRVVKAMPSLRRRKEILMTGGWTSVLKCLEKDEVKLSRKRTISEYAGKPGVRAMTEPQKAMLSELPIVLPKNPKNITDVRKAQKLNKQVLNDSNVLHSVLCGWPVFNKYQTAKSFIEKRSQCGHGFQENRSRSGMFFPERRFVRYVNTVNRTARDLIDNTRLALRNHGTLVNRSPAMRERIKLINKWCYVVHSADYDTMCHKHVGRRALNKDNSTQVLLGLKYAIVKRLGTP